VTNEHDDLERLRRAMALVLAAIGLVAAVAAVLGFPLLFVVGRGPSNVGRFASVFRSEVSAWLDHDGWALSGSAWFYTAFALAAFASAALVAGVIRARGARAIALISGPAVLVLMLGPLLQYVSGDGWSNYSDFGDDFLPHSPVFAAVLLALWCLALGPKLAREHRRSRKADMPERTNRGVRGVGRHRM
jgi:hypothetical protein